MTSPIAARSAPGRSAPDWLNDDLGRVEDIIVSAAGSSRWPIVSEPSLHLIRAGGKRLRPSLVLLAARAGNEAGRATDLAAAAIELVHLATLYHDDVIDGTKTRRGVATAHVQWGTEVAVLAGDFLFACGCGLGAEAGGEVPGILARAIAEVCEGEIVETAALGDPHRPVGEYVETIRNKTAALFRAACELGATTAGAGKVERAALVSYGEGLGLAFQIVDDLLDLIGDPQVTGKALGTDLNDGVYTIPVLLGAARDPSLAARLLAGDRRVEEVVPVLRATGSLDDALEIARSHAGNALEALAVIPGSRWCGALEGIVHGVVSQVVAH
jgi:geranylgeranyl pyrophosphate synthase